MVTSLYYTTTKPVVYLTVQHCLTGEELPALNSEWDWLNGLYHWYVKKMLS